MDEEREGGGTLGDREGLRLGVAAGDVLDGGGGRPTGGGGKGSAV